MIETSSLYKTLFDQGAIQDYQIVIDGVVYDKDVIYDHTQIQEKLFDTNTFTIGSFTVTSLKVKLWLSNNQIPRNAEVKFYYRYVSDEEQSEWILRFVGNVVDRTRYTDEITTITAFDKAANYDIFLDHFSGEISSYPANARTVANLCATHLGLVIDNISDVYNGNIVEYPNELTIVQVLQNIAKASGGNWAIVGEDKLRMVVLENTTPILEYNARTIAQSELLSPISKVRVYWQDDSAFEAGDDSGSVLEIDNPWATQANTDYLLSALGGYEYVPVSGKGVYADPALQLGDTFKYSNGVQQTVVKVKWTFDGITTADIETPQENEISYDNPYDILAQQEFKKKVTLGDSYQGVSIGRDTGIQMLLSPDGTEENATGRYYADLNKGMAFQTRTSPSEDWFDWMYFDKNEGIFRLSLYNTSEETDAKIELSVRDINNINIIPNNVGIDGVRDWTFVSQGVEFQTPSAEFNGKWEFVSPTGAIARNVTTTTLAQTGFEIWGRGSMISGKGRIIHPNDRYCLRVYTKGAGNLVFKVNELDSGDNLLKTTTLSNISASVGWTQYDSEFIPLYNTESVQIEIVSTLNPYLPEPELSQFSDLMLVRNVYKDYELSAKGVLDYAQAELSVMADEISLKVSTDEVISAINLSTEGVKIQGPKIQLEGVVTANSYFKILSDGSMEAVNGKFTGEIISNTGKIGDFDINNLGLTKTWTWTTKTFVQADMDRLQGILTKEIIPTQQDYEQYDTNRDGKLTNLDLVRIQRCLLGITPNPLTITYTATIQPDDAYSAISVVSSISNESDTATNIGSARVKTNTGDFRYIYFNDKELTVDENGFVKVK